MIRFAKSFGLAAILFSAAVPALAAERVQIGDLSLSTSAGAATLDSRIAAAARHFCANEGVVGLAAVASCRADVRTEVMEKLSAAQRGQLVAAVAHRLTVAAR